MRLSVASDVSRNIKAMPLTRRRWASRARSSAARAAYSKIEREADPDGVLTADELARRADHLMQAHMLRMTIAAKKARSRPA
jgi:hypothetical protein